MGYKADDLVRTVVDGDFCIGCGACAALKDSSLEMEWTRYGIYKPTAQMDNSVSAAECEPGKVCPFYMDAENENTIAQKLYADSGAYDERVGFHRGIWAGSVADGGRREKCTSGGLTTWLLCKLMENGLIDGVIHVSDSENGHGQLFRYSISKSIHEICHAAKSRYYPVECSEVLSAVRESGGRYAFVGAPCFVKAVRLLAKQNSQLAESIKYCISIFCGHMKTAAFAEALGWQIGVPPNELVGFDFRVKYDGKPASRYGVRAYGERDGKRYQAQALVSELAGSDWGLGFFRPNACDFCDDIAGETADASFGDAWLPEYVADSRGTNVAIIREPVLADLFIKGIRDGEIECAEISPDSIYQSQAGNFRHRRDGLSYRLWVLDQQAKWRPPKRVKPACDHLSERRQLIYKLRSLAAELSHTSFAEAKERGDLSIFLRKMGKVTRSYHRENGTLLRYLVKCVVVSVKRALRGRRNL